MTTAELKQAYINLYTQVTEIKNLIREGNRKTNEPHLSDESMEIYEHYTNELKEKIEELTGEKSTLVIIHSIKHTATTKNIPLQLYPIKRKDHPNKAEQSQAII